MGLRFQFKLFIEFLRLDQDGINGYRSLDGIRFYPGDIDFLKNCCIRRVKGWSLCRVKVSEEITIETEMFYAINLRPEIAFVLGAKFYTSFKISTSKGDTLDQLVRGFIK
jgi:hypothetical protein